MLDHITWRLMPIKRFVIRKDRWCGIQACYWVFIPIPNAAAVISKNVAIRAVELF
jgi:hypothetical protein